MKNDRVGVEQYLSLVILIFLVELIITGVLVKVRDNEFNIIVLLFNVSNVIGFLIIFIMKSKVLGIINNDIHFKSFSFSLNKSISTKFEILEPSRLGLMGDIVTQFSTFNDSVNRIDNNHNVLYGNYDLYFPSVNPASGLPMIDSCIDVGGNTYGFYNQP